jgi:hypothetical protein
MADGYAPALFLEVLAFWLILRCLLIARLVLFLGRAVVLLMVLGLLETLDGLRLVWAACFAGSAALLPVLRRPSFRQPGALAWRSKSADEVAALCERLIGVQVDAATPAVLFARAPERCVLALAGDGVRVLEDESRMGRPRIGRVTACWDRASLVAHVEHSRRRARFEPSWPRQGALVRGVMRSGTASERFVGHLVADEFGLRAG